MSQMNLPRCDKRFHEDAAPCAVWSSTRKHILTPEVTVTRQIDARMRHSAVRERQVPANSAQISIFARDG